MPISTLLLLVLGVGLILGAVSSLALRHSGAFHAVGRRLAGPPEVPVGRLLDGPVPERPIRVAGRIRCRAPLDMGDGERLVGFALSEGSMTTLLEAGASEEDVVLDRLRAVAQTMPEPMPWWIGYRVWIGLK